jgi:hypothetical protein
MLDYHDDPRLSNSKLTAFLRELNGEPSFFAKEETLEFGRLFHTALYEGAKFQEKDLLTLPANLRPKFQRMLIAALSSATVRMFVNHPDAVFEKAVFFDLYGVPFKIRPDVIIPSRKAGHDAKTTVCSSLDDFVDTFDKYGYWRQAECYKTGAGLTKFFFTGVSKSGNHNTFTVDVSKHADKMRKAKKEVRELIQLYKEKKP